MSGRGAHAALALVGIIAGLPVAAVVQWNREPPPVIWSTVGAMLCVPGHDLLGPNPPSFIGFAISPGGPRSTSVGDLGVYCTNGGSFHLGVVGFPPRILRRAEAILWSRSMFHGLSFDPPLVVRSNGIDWHRVTMGGGF